MTSFQLKITQRLLDGFWILVAQNEALDEICSFLTFLLSIFFKKQFKTVTNRPSKQLVGDYLKCPESIEIYVFSKIFPILNKYFSEMRKFQPKPLKPRCDIGLKTPNPEGFWITLKTQQVRFNLVSSSRISRGGPPLDRNNSAGACPFNKNPPINRRSSNRGGFLWDGSENHG